MKNRIRKRSWHWPTLIGDISITTGHMGSASVQLEGRTISRHHGPHAAAQAAGNHQTGDQEWDNYRLPVPALRHWGQLIEVAFHPHP